MKDFSVMLRINRAGDVVQEMYYKEKTISQKGKEVITTRQKEVPFMAVTNAYYRCMFEKEPEEVGARVAAMFEIQKDYIDKVIPSKRFEVLGLMTCLDSWLIKDTSSRKKPLQKYLFNVAVAPDSEYHLDIQDGVHTNAIMQEIDDSPYNYFLNYAMQYNSVILPYKVHKSSKDSNLFHKEEEQIIKSQILQYVKAFYADTLFPLAWAEIAYCLENDITLKHCRSCWNLFQVTGRNKVFCCGQCAADARKRSRKKKAAQE